MAAESRLFASELKETRERRCQMRTRAKRVDVDVDD